LIVGPLSAAAVFGLLIPRCPVMNGSHWTRHSSPLWVVRGLGWRIILSASLNHPRYECLLPDRGRRHNQRQPMRFGPNAGLFAIAFLVSLGIVIFCRSSPAKTAGLADRPLPAIPAPAGAMASK